MPTTEQLRAKLIAKLRELFQLNQPDLDFGFYRIMHAKAKEVDAFLSNSLPLIIEQSFGGMSEGKKAELQAAYEKAVDTAKSFGAPDPEATEPVKKAKTALKATKNTARDEAEVYDHLYRFFERYYDNGDFVSLRYLTRETDRKAKPYAVPYGGEEVMLHWANSDQYYIKTSENFSSFSFDLSQAKEFRDMSREEKILSKIPGHPMKVHFKIVGAEEGEHGNVKASEERFFLIRKDRPFDIPDAGDAELTVYFEYRADTEKTGQTGSWQKKRNQEAKARVLEYLASMASSLDSKRASHPIHSYLSMLSTPVPTDSDKSRTLLDRYIEQYTARNTSDYFIHKDLGGFLKRELDFYIKNEIMQLDNVENADAPAVESYLAKIRVLRRIATQLIEFLAQLENFQKKLWLKKKFVVETNYCVTLDRVPKKLWPEVAGNLKQWQEWQKLGFVEVHGNGRAFATDMPAPKEITVSFLPDDTKYMIQLDERGPIKIDGVPAQDVIVNEGKNTDGLLNFSGDATLETLFTEHSPLIIDTVLYSTDFKNELLRAIDGIDEQCNGLLVHSDNFQALNLLQERYHEQVKCIYIDPPYNTESSAILYKNDYKHSSFATMIFDRLSLLYQLIPSNGAIFVSIDKTERTTLEHTMDEIFGVDNRIEELIWAMNTNNSQAPNYSTNHEYVLVYAKNKTVAEQDKNMFREPKPGFEEVMALVAQLNPSYPAVAKIEDELRKLYERHKIAYREELEEQGLDPEDEMKNDPWKGLYNYNNAEYRDAIGELVPENKAKKSNAKIWIWRESDASMPATKQAASTRDPKHENWRFYQPGHPVTGKPCPHPKSGWKFAYADENSSSDKRTFVSLDMEHRIVWGKDETKIPQLKRMLHEVETNVGKSVFSDYSDGEKQTSAMFGRSGIFLAPKHADFVSRFILHSAKSDSTILDCFGGSGSTAHAVIKLNREDRGKRHYITVEVSDYFDHITKPRILKAAYASEWRSGKPSSNDGLTQIVKYIRLESYEDSLNNLEFAGGDAFAANPELHTDYLLHYMLDVETQGSASLLNIKSFANPFDYKLKVKKPGSEESELRTVDLLETFNYLIGLRVKQIFAPQRFSAKFERLPDPELPDDQKTKLTLKGRLRLDSEGKWLFRKVEGWIPKNRFTPNDGAKENILVIWRALTGDLEHDNIVLDEFFERECLNANDTEFDTIYVNGSNNLPNLKREGDKWKVRLIEEDFMNRMWEE